MSTPEIHPECFQVETIDNVATLLQDALSGMTIDIRGTQKKTIVVAEDIKAGHKVALCAIPAGTFILKYGFPMGAAIRDIARGEWVHLHNCRSLHDEKSSSLDLESGARKETAYV
ncbi:MAG TPA: UxaA family hydrolase [Edaphobacter sp.]|jgi:hypothetical protein